MVTTARPRPMPARAPVRAAGRPGARPAAAAAAAKVSTHELTSSQMSQLVVQGTLIATAILAVIGGIIFFFGDTLRNHLLPMSAATITAPSAATGPAPTLLYRDRGDGSFTVLEIDGHGSTRVKGTVDRNDVPLLQADKVREGWGSPTTSSNPNSRVNALGSAFR